MKIEDATHDVCPRELVGRQYASPWQVIDQALVSRFAEVTGDHQFIHVDPVGASATPFGGTIAHGFLLLSILPQLHAAAERPRVPQLAMAINYGFDRVRFVSPVRTGSRVRAVFAIADIAERRAGEWQQEMDVTLEVEGASRPAMTARWLSRLTLSP